ncbi:glutathione S-transferase [Oceanococcus atlanticus]|uniref:Glutathione S-transferase n=1 Tax=Oceanococcus atlanticus TaxID=1317117 RepID=A0A1Y1SFL9_9GAMM|nr:glutathione S-transferase family protein [Oceanococcus atlanticus]ORE88454.1 glutathione S-transferase [Oceanococcus atlanticus]
MLLYGSKMAPNSDRVEMYLHEKGVEIPFRQIELMKGEHHAEEYKSIAPNRKVPALVLDDGTVIRESIAICRYIEELHPQPPLFGATPVQRAQVEMYQRIMELELMMPIAMTFRHGHPAAKALEPIQVNDFAELQRTVALKRIKVLNKELADREFLLGDDFTVADITAYIGLGFGRISKIAPDEQEHPHVVRYLKTIAARPSAQALRAGAGA